MDSSYKPQPIDTSDVVLSDEILTLTERLAKNAHDNWARGRFSQGWVYGPERNDEHKQHPCLIPYEELPDSEKDYDRNLALQTIKAMIAMGYRIDKER